MRATPSGIALLSLLISSFSFASEPLPEPLTLEAALGTSSALHPNVSRAVANKELASAAHDKVLAADDFNLELSLEGRHVDAPEISSYDDDNDSRASLTLTKNLYDFGRTKHASNASEQRLEANQDIAALATQKQRNIIMERFFDVIVADLNSASATEVMTMKFLQHSKAKDRHAVGELTEVDLLKLETAYQVELKARNLANNNQRVTRARLALAMNRPGDLPSDLESPELPGLNKPIPDYDTLLLEARENNLALNALKKKLEASREQQVSAKAKRNPNLYLKVEAIEYQQEFGSRTPLMAILGLDIPLYQGGRVDAEMRSQLAQSQKIQAKLIELDYLISDEILTVWQDITALTAQLKQSDILSDYRELYLDRSRANYELELKTDLGNAMAEQSKAQGFAAKTRFDLAMAREKLAILTQNPQYSALQPADSASAPKE